MKMDSFLERGNPQLATNVYFRVHHGWYEHFNCKSKHRKVQIYKSERGGITDQEIPYEQTGNIPYFAHSPNLLGEQLFFHKVLKLFVVKRHTLIQHGPLKLKHNLFFSRPWEAPITRWLSNRRWSSWGVAPLRSYRFFAAELPAAF